MLLQLTVKNFAIIEQLSLNLTPGLNVITGETGAGKSIIVDAVGLLLGGRALSEYIREGEEKSYLEGVFDCPDQELFFPMLEEMGIETDREDILVLSREISRSGRNICRVNGRSITLNQFREVGQHLIDLHGQQEQQSLINAERQLTLLDSFAGEKAAVIKQELKHLFIQLSQTERELEQLKQNERETSRLIDLLSFQIEEITSARLTQGEEQELSRERNMLQHAEKLALGASQVYQQLYGGGRVESAFDQVSKVVGELKQLVQYDSKIKDMIENGESAQLLIEETAQQLRRYQEALEPDPLRLEQIEERLALIKQLKRKYGDSEEEIIGFAAAAGEELERLGKRESLIGELDHKCCQIKDKYWKEAETLSGIRKKAAENLEKAMAEELAALQMPGVKFAVRLAEKGWSPLGIDETEFMLSTNPGEPLKPLSRIASGGETSRIMLALKAILARVDRMPTLIFDEIDTGIGGRALESVASRLSHVADECQVICVTHAPQIACRASTHLLIDKMVEGGRTRTRVVSLDDEDRVQEIARMLSGDTISPVTLKHAEEMLNKGKNKL